MSRGLATRIAKLERQQKRKGKTVVGVIASRFGHLIADPDKPGHLKFEEPPEGFDAFALKQQTALQAELVALALSDAPKPKDPQSVGIQSTLAPMPHGKKRPRFIEVGGEEIDTLALREN